MNNLTYHKFRKGEYQVWKNEKSKTPNGDTMHHHILIGTVKKTASGKYWIPMGIDTPYLYKTRQAAAVELLNV